MKNLHAALACALMAWALPLLADGPRPVAQIGERLLLSKPAGAITLDGVLAEPAWQSADAVSDFTAPQGAKPFETVVKALHDDQRLYLGIRCQVDDRASIVVVQPEGGAVYRDDSMEIFLDPAHDARNAWQIAVNAAGAVCMINLTDRSKALPRGDYLDAKANWDEATRSYTLEIAINRARFNLTGPQTKSAGIAFLRNQQVTAGGNRLYRFLWTSQDPSAWGHLLLADPASFSTLTQNYRARLDQAARATRDEGLTARADALRKDLPRLTPDDKAFLAEFESRLLALEEDSTSRYWRTKFGELFKE